MKGKLVPHTVIVTIVLILVWNRYGLSINDWLIIQNLDSIAPNELLIEKFERTVFHNELESRGYKFDGLLTKWTLPIGVRLRNKEILEFQTHIENTIQNLSNLSGLDIHLHDGTIRKRSLLDIYIAPPDRIEAILKYYDISQSSIDMVDDALCLATAISTSHIKTYSVTDRGVITIRDTLSEQNIQHCIVEELTQVLGLDSDTDILQPSIMSDNIPFQLDRLPLNDKIMVRTLYDKRLKPGMTRNEAMPIVRKIIPELVTAVKEHGEEALYQ